MKKKLYLGDCLEILKTIPENRIDTCITDPPYELGFMNKDWDSAGISFQKETWEAVYRVLKPGALLLAFGGTRTWHRIAVAIEDAGFEIRDTICWLYGQGFPKSYNIGKGIDKKAGKEREVIGKYTHPGLLDGTRSGRIWDTALERPIDNNVYGKDERTLGDRHNITAPATPEAELWEGYGTALKPAFEPIIIAMKPIDGTYVNNALTHGVAGMWIDGGRISPDKDYLNGASNLEQKEQGQVYGWAKSGKYVRCEPNKDGRWPSNVILDETSAEMLDKQTEYVGNTKPHPVKSNVKKYDGYGNITNKTGEVINYNEPNANGASRFFYCAKASKKERNAGLDNIKEKTVTRMATHGGGSGIPSKGMERFSTKSKNSHPTVKPLALMEYLCKLTRTPTGGIVLDPFMGSGTTGMACVNTDRDFIGIELVEEHYIIARKRIEYTQQLLKEN